VIAIPEPTAPQAISRAAPPSAALGGGVTIRKLQKSGQGVRQAKQTKPPRSDAITQDSRR
jgi:hypothetical protein